ncbi:MAG: SpoIIE family protein phosphatase [Oscillospiraceae bacterium]|nr:SpoIIE family protein phosphatase [Oscillospiraceae bacterium]
MFRGLSRKLIVIMCLFAVMLSSAVGYIGYRTYMNSVFDSNAKFAAAVLRLGLTYIDADDMRECLETGEKSQRYINTQIVFNNIKETTDITGLYFFKVTDEGKMVYYLNAYTERDIESLSENSFIVSLADEDRLPDEIALALIQDEIWIIPNVSEYGYMMGAYCAVMDSTGQYAGIIASEINMDDIYATLRFYVITVCIGASAIMAAFTLLAIAYLRKKITAPIQRLSEAADSFVSGDKDDSRELHPIVSDIETGDEIETLSKSMEKMTTDLIAYIENLTAVTAEKERIGAELSVATKIQVSMLPCIFPAFPDLKEIDIYASMTPAKEVGGDFYDFFLVDEDTLAVVIADVSGKGVPAALFMVIAKTLIKNTAQQGFAPKEVFERVNNILCANNDAGMFVTVFMGYFNIKTGNFTFVNAGHNPPLQKHDGKYDWVKIKPGFPLAGMEDMRYKEGEFVLQPGDELFMFTDGISEATDSNNELYGDPRLHQKLNSCKSDTLSGIIKEVKEDIDAFADGAPQFDDITMLILKYKG